MHSQVKFRYLGEESSRAFEPAAAQNHDACQQQNAINLILPLCNNLSMVIMPR